MASGATYFLVNIQQEERESYHTGLLKFQEISSSEAPGQCLPTVYWTKTGHMSRSLRSGERNVLIWFKPKRAHSTSEVGWGHLSQKQSSVRDGGLRRWILNRNQSLLQNTKGTMS